MLDFLAKASILPHVYQAVGVNQQNQANADAAMTANTRNVENMHAQNAWQTAANQKSMDFSERMSNTSHQRQVADLKAAGLNPILSVNAGASAPQGNTSSGGSAGSAPMPRMENMLDGKMVLEGLRANADIGLTKAMTNKTNVEAGVAAKGIPESDMKNRIYNELNRRFDEARRSKADKERAEKRPGVRYKDGKFIYGGPR